MRINEAYEHDVILPYQAECTCPVDSCDRISTQCVDITAPITLIPAAAIGAVTVTCQGAPVVTCEADAAGLSCTVRVIQQVCVSLPVRYSVDLVAGEPTIACADNGCTNCGC